ncbi:RNA-guided endonuclease IscB [Sutterella wadsworthensis]|uniref:RNA-guided endonuclease IscB n=1 Tax=Sutterella wadsworthensis TaxID=40545 RepID=UPI00241E889C|nr:RNA-guided endonuclease IscB [Sutterella wadsworthensis]
MSTTVFVLDKKKRPLMPCRPSRARRLLRAGRARVVKLYPFTIRLVDRMCEESAVQSVLVKIDPGSKETGIAVVREDEKKHHHALAFFDVVHRGAAIRDAMAARSALRRRRRSANLRYRAPRFNNRRRREGWLPPSLQHRVDSTLSWVARLRRLAPVSGLAVEIVKFDAQKLQNPEISGTEYQQGTLFSYDVREYLLEKFGRKCVYCGAQNVPLNIDHVVPRAAGGSDRVSNLVLACISCNQKKGAQTVASFLKGRPDVLARVNRQLKTSLRDAAAVNATRWALYRVLQNTALQVETGTGALTKFNRHVFGVTKEHWLDALCVGRVNGVHIPKSLFVLQVRCTGRGSRQRTRLTKYGFPRGCLMRYKRVHGFATGDMVEADVPSGKKAGFWRGRVAVWASGSFNIQTPEGVVQGVSWKYCRLISHNDGYGYAWLRPAPHSSLA